MQDSVKDYTNEQKYQLQPPEGSSTTELKYKLQDIEGACNYYQIGDNEGQFYDYGIHFMLYILSIFLYVKQCRFYLKHYEIKQLLTLI